jgi:hypothetical protein
MKHSKVFEALDLSPTLRAVIELRDRQRENPKLNALGVIEQTLGMTLRTTSDRLNDLNAAYIVQNTVQHPDAKIEEIVSLSLEQALVFENRITTGDLKYTTATVEDEQPIVIGEAPKAKKGAKKSQAIALWTSRSNEDLTRKQWIELLVSEVGMTAAGASTYYSALKKGTMK